MTVDAGSVTDLEVAHLLKAYGEKKLVAMVLLLAAANFQDRVLLSLGVAPEEDGPLPAIEVQFSKSAPAPSVPKRSSPEILHGPDVPTKVDDPEWLELGYDVLQKGLETQRAKRRADSRAFLRRRTQEASGRFAQAEGPCADQVESGLHGLPAAVGRRRGRQVPGISVRRRSRTGFSKRVFSGSSPARSVAFTEWAIAKCCSRSRASTKKSWKHAPGCWLRVTGQVYPVGIGQASSSQGSNRRRRGRSTTWTGTP